MTLRDRTALIDRAVHNAERAFPCASSATLFELARSALAREHGLVVSDEEIQRALSAAAEPLA